LLSTPLDSDSTLFTTKTLASNVQCLFLEISHQRQDADLIESGRPSTWRLTCDYERITSLNTLALANTKIDKKFERLTPVSKEEFNEVSG